MAENTSEVETTPEWDPDYYAERVGRFVDMNTDFEKETVARADIAQFVRDELDTDYLNETINVALAQDLIVERDENRYAPAE
ncbi:hypothetical protein [Halogranum rubrum]|uniref:Uncharacterized protein n=1 Tax=Halogranum salarium B-1 TaxID=1210908 RepID=J3JH65_9EURY|nr:hypothetical protein [Halogranum salarium]EJN60716.1 hypothetical protein HSB1_13190 [Halogranum salarium B-1]